MIKQVLDAITFHIQCSIDSLLASSSTTLYVLSVAMGGSRVAAQVSSVRYPISGVLWNF